MLLQQSAIYLAGRLVPGVVSVMTIAVLTRLLSAEDYGTYALVVAAGVITSGILFHWLALSVGRMLAAQDTDPRSLLSTALVTFLGLAFATVLVGLGIASVWPDQDLAWAVVFAIALACAQGWFDLNLKVANARLAAGRYGLAVSARAVLSLAISVVLVWRGFGPTGALLGPLLSVLVSPLVFRGYWNPVSAASFRRAVARKLLAYGAPLTLTLTMMLVLGVSDRFVIGVMMGADAVGAYAASYDLAQLTLGGLTNVIYLASFPIVVRAYEAEGKQRADVQLQRSLVALTGVAIPATLGLMILAENFAQTLLGSDVREQAPTLIPLIALGTGLWGIKSYFDYAFQLKNMTQRQVPPVLVAAVMNLLLNILLVPRLGLLGSALATLVAYGLGTLLTWVAASRCFNFPPLPSDVYKILLAGAAMLVALLPIRGNLGVAWLVAQVAVGGLVYGMCLLACNAGNLRHRLLHCRDSAGRGTR